MKYPRLPAIIVCAALAVWSVVACAESGSSDDEAIQRIRESFPETEIAQIGPTPVPGLYEIRLGAQISYITADGRYLLQGDLYDSQEDVNLTEVRRTKARAQAVNDIGESSMIIFEPDNATRTITVFTDIDCGYCRKLHRQIDDYNALGIKVRYMFYPRSGPNTDSWFKAEGVWCSDDRNAALTLAKGGAVLDVADCGSTPIEQHYQLGRSFGIRGTPGIFVYNGKMRGGYRPPDEMLA
jgi:thiol:disulfide interchange protein DsbC